MVMSSNNSADGFDAHRNKLKVCFQCTQLKPANDLYFAHDKGRADGLAVTCKACRKAQAERMEAFKRRQSILKQRSLVSAEKLSVETESVRLSRVGPDGGPLIRCTTCGVDYPATAEYFYRDRTRSNGLKHRCKKCCLDYSRSYLEKRGTIPNPQPETSAVIVSAPFSGAVVKTEQQSRHSRKGRFGLLEENEIIELSGVGGYTAVELAGAYGVSPNTIGRILRGQYRPAAKAEGGFIPESAPVEPAHLERAADKPTLTAPTTAPVLSPPAAVVAVSPVQSSAGVVNWTYVLIVSIVVIGCLVALGLLIITRTLS